MEVDLIFKIAAIGILVAVLNQLLIRSGREEQGLVLVLAGLVTTMVLMLKLLLLMMVMLAIVSSALSKIIFGAPSGALFYAHLSMIFFLYVI